jgi:hypothetical protein
MYDHMTLRGVSQCAAGKSGLKICAPYSLPRLKGSPPNRESVRRHPARHIKAWSRAEPPLTHEPSLEADVQQSATFSRVDQCPEMAGLGGFPTDSFCAANHESGHCRHVHSAGKILSDELSPKELYDHWAALPGMMGRPEGNNSLFTTDVDENYLVRLIRTKILLNDLISSSLYV